LNIKPILENVINAKNLVLKVIVIIITKKIVKKTTRYMYVKNVTPYFIKNAYYITIRTVLNAYPKTFTAGLTPIKKTFNLATISQLNVDLANAKWGKLGNDSCSFVAHNIEYILQVMANTRYGKSILDKDVDFAVEQELLTNFYGQKNIMTEFEHKKRAIFLAILLNDQEWIKGILDKEDESSKDLLVNCLDYDESTPLHYAARHGNEEMIKILRKHDALIKKNKRGGTPVMSILIRNFDPELKKRLINAFNLSIDYLKSIQGSDDKHGTIKNLINSQNNNND
jgi:hypothetical protein